jgi:hypothetical protein
VTMHGGELGEDCRDGAGALVGTAQAIATDEDKSAQVLCPLGD